MAFLKRLFGGSRDRTARPLVALPATPFPAVEPADAAGAIASGKVDVVDVRFDGEFAESRIPGASHVPLPEIPSRTVELPRDRDLLVVCGGGARSLEACRILRAAGLTRVRWLRGGLASYPGALEKGTPGG